MHCGADRDRGLRSLLDGRALLRETAFESSTGADSISDRRPPMRASSAARLEVRQFDARLASADDADKVRLDASVLRKRLGSLCAMLTSHLVERVALTWDARNRGRAF